MISLFSKNRTAVKALVETFEHYQIESVWFDDFDEAFSQTADLYIFDDLDFEQIKQTQSKQAPCFYLQETENSSENTITKPFKPLELLSKIYPALMCALKGNVILIKDGILNAVKNTFTFGDSIISLTSKEAQLLFFLSQNTTGLTREELLEFVWGYSPDLTTHTLETHIYTLRNKLEATNINIILSGDKYTIA